jgi:hypothetical protein
MAVGGHGEAIRQFLNGESRQVWAVHRETDEPFFLPEGQAEALRAFTKSSLRCPHPDCTVTISTRGGSKRDHFFHVNSPPHETGRESEFHLASKAMLSAWLAPRLPEGATVREEETVKDPATHLLRRADVMVTGRSGRQVAYEVEYKSFAVEAWLAKQTDYGAKHIACAWLIGHSRVRLATGPSYLVGLGETAVRVPELAAAIARAGQPLLVINPVTRQIGTLAGDSGFTRPFTGAETLAWLAVERLEDCTFEARRGIVTPTMRRLDGFGAERQKRAAEEAEKARQIEAATRAQESFRERRKRTQKAAWQASPVFRAFQERWADVPPEIAADSLASEYINADPAHWHGVLYEELLHGREQGCDFRWRDVFVALDKHGITRRRETNGVFRALAAYFQDLQRIGLVLVHRDPRKSVLLFSCTGRTLEQARAAVQAEHEAEQRRREERKQAREHFGREEEGSRSAQARAMESRALTKLVILEDGTRRWVRK